MKSKNKNLILLRILLKSTSLANNHKYTKDSKKKSKIVGNYIGLFFIYLLLGAYCVFTCAGYGMLGMTDSIPVLNALSVSLIAFLFTFLKTNGYLFNFKEYDMIMSLPFETKTIAACKFLYMYIKSLPFYMCISLAMMVGYGIFAKPFFIIYVLWIVLSLLLPIIPMLAAAFIGFVIARITAGFKKTNIFQTIFTFAFVLLCFMSRFIIEAIIEDGEVGDTLGKLSETTSKIGKIYLPAGWFSNAIVNIGISDILLLIGCTILLFELVFIPVGKSYRQINSSLKSHAASKEYKITKQKKKSLVSTIAYKEFKRMLGSTVYITNAGLGEVLTIILGIVVLFVGFDKVLATILNGAPVTVEMIYPAIPLVVYFLIGMISTTTCSPSLEGKNIWIIQSLPINKRVLYKGKMLFNMLLTVPFMTFGIVCICISAKVPVISTIIFVIEGIIMCAFSTAWGCVCGIKHIKIEWENEIEVIKQGSAVAIYMLPNMFVTMGLVVLVVFLGTKIEPMMVSVVLAVIVAVLAVLSYIRAMKLADKQKYFS